jgi:ribosome-interacting GTPase 1
VRRPRNRVNSIALLGAKGIDLHPAGTEAPAASRPGCVSKPALLVVTGTHRPTAERDLGALRELHEVPWPLVPVSTVTRGGLGELSQRTFEALGIMRIHTKEPGKDPDRERPFTCRGGVYRN